MELKQERDILYDIMCELTHNLSEVEWSGRDQDTGTACCPACGAMEYDKHASDCKLNAILIRASRAEKGDFSDN